MHALLCGRPCDGVPWGCPPPTLSTHVSGVCASTPFPAVGPPGLACAGLLRDQRPDPPPAVRQTAAGAGRHRLRAAAARPPRQVRRPCAHPQPRCHAETAVGSCDEEMLFGLRMRMSVCLVCVPACLLSLLRVVRIRACQLCAPTQVFVRLNTCGGDGWGCPRWCLPRIPASWRRPSGCS